MISMIISTLLLFMLLSLNNVRIMINVFNDVCVDV